MPSRPSSVQRRRKSYVELYEEEEFEVRLDRRRATRQHGLGLTVAGGGGSHPYKVGEEGIFVARIVPGGAADLAGVQVDDEILAINGVLCYHLDHYQAVDLLRYSGGDLNLRIKRKSPRLVESAIPQAHNLGPLIRSRSSYHLPQDQSVNMRPRRRSRSSSQPRLSTDPHGYPVYQPEEGNDGYLRPRSPIGSTGEGRPKSRSRRTSSYQPESYIRPTTPAASIISSSSALQHTHFDSTGGVHFHPYCFACNPSVVHLLPATPQLGYPPPEPSFTPPSHRHIYAQPASVNGSYPPSPIHLRTYDARRPSRKSWQSDTSEDDSSGRERITVHLRRDDYNGLGFVVSSRDAQPYSSSGGVFVSGIVKGGVADRSGQLFIGDRILSINGIDVEQARHRDVVALLSRSKPYVQLEIERPDHLSSDVNGDYPSEVFDSPEEPELMFDSSSRRSSARSESAPPSRRNTMTGDESSPLPRKTILKPTSRTSDYYRRSSTPPPPPPLDLMPTSDPSRRVSKADDNDDLRFPPPPTDLGRFRETITKQTLTETIVTRVTNNQKGKWPVIIEDVVIHKSPGSRLGLRIAGGKDSSCIPFGTPEEPRGIFISRVIPGGAASRTERLRIGDRILKINGNDVTDWTHPEVIRALWAAPAPEVILTVRHDPQPTGLDELIIHRKEDERYGIKIIGGVREQASYQTKIYDSGIFVSQVHRGGAIGRDGRVKVGMRLLEVNGTNMIGVTRQEAIEAFRRAGHVLRLLVCDGWNNKEVPTTPSSSRKGNALLGEESSSLLSSLNGGSLDRRRSAGHEQLDKVGEDGGSRRRTPSIHSGRSTPTSPLTTKIKMPKGPKEPRILGIKVSDLTGSRHFPKSPTPSLSGSLGSEKNKEVQTTTIVMSKTESLRPDREVFDEDDDDNAVGGTGAAGGSFTASPRFQR